MGRIQHLPSTCQSLDLAFAIALDLLVPEATIVAHTERVETPPDAPVENRKVVEKRRPEIKLRTAARFDREATTTKHSSEEPSNPVRSILRTWRVLRSGWHGNWESHRIGGSPNHLLERC